MSRANASSPRSARRSSSSPAGPSARRASADERRTFQSASVVERLADEDAEVRAAAAVALGRLGHWPSAPAVAALLTDRDWNVRRSAALALRALGPAGELLLRRALRDEDAFARDMAQQTLDLPEAVLPR